MWSDICVKLSAAEQVSWNTFAALRYFVHLRSECVISISELTPPMQSCQLIDCFANNQTYSWTCDESVFVSLVSSEMCDNVIVIVVPTLVRKFPYKYIPSMLYILTELGHVNLLSDSNSSADNNHSPPSLTNVAFDHLAIRNCQKKVFLSVKGNCNHNI